MNANISPSPAADLLLICEPDPDSAAALRRIAEALGCDWIEAADPHELSTLLNIRRPTIVALAVDSPNIDGLLPMSILAQVNARPATLLVGGQDERVLAGVKRMATARGLSVIAARRRPLVEADVEQLLLDHVIGPLRIERTELDRGLAEHEFLLLYQPKISLNGSGMQVIGVEALVRWRHPRRGTLLPRHFLPAVEQHGMRMPLADMVITEAIRQAGVWNARGVQLQVAINLSPGLVQDREFPDRLAALLREQEVPPSQITLDVTDTINAQDRELIQDVFTRLRVMGVGIALDNFGNGLSPLSEIYRMPFSEIKIDRRMLEDAVHDRDAELVVRALVDMAHQLRLTVCAKAVETAQLLEFIRSAEFDAAQGRLFSEPVVAGRIEDLVGALNRSRSPGSGVWRALNSRTVHRLPARPALEA